MEPLNQKQNRNTSIDLIKSFAIGLVVLGHVIAGSVTGSCNTILMDIIWTLQIPLFMIVGGFVVQFSRKVNNVKTFFSIYWAPLLDVFISMGNMDIFY